MRLIDAEALKKQLLDYFTYSMQLCAEISDIIDNAPTIEPNTDTISRQGAINLIEQYCNNGCEISDYNWCPDCQRSKFAEMIKALPPSPSIPIIP